MRETVKNVARGVSLLLVLPALLSFHLRAIVLGRDRALVGSAQAFAFLPGLLGQYLRRAFLSHVLEACHPTATIEFGTLFSQCGTRIGARAYLGPRCHIGLADIGDDVLLAAGVHVPSGGSTHGISDIATPIRDQPGHAALVRIGDGAWIGSAFRG